MTTATPGGEVALTTSDTARIAPRSSPPVDDGGLFRRLYPALRRFAAACAPVAIEPDDLVQQAVANTLARRRLVDLDNPLAYLRSAIINLAKNQYRADSREQVVAAPADSTDNYPSDLAVLAELSPRDRAALYLIEIERLPYREAAALIDCTTVALRARVSRARKRLRNEIKNGVTP